MNDSLQTKYNKLTAILKDMRRVAVAFSGGVDSSLLCAVAYKELGDNSVAISVLSDFITADEHNEINSIAGFIGIALHIINVDVLANELISANSKERCYYCKTGVFTEIKAKADELGGFVVVDGSNTDDTGDYRPGMKALSELGVRSPLLEAGLSKAEIRQLSAHFNLPTAVKPSAACLASRIPYDSVITSAKLRRVENAEHYLHSIGFVQLRVRDYTLTNSILARIEVVKQDFEKIIEKNILDDIVATLKKYGYDFVTLDLSGFSSGSMNININKN